MEPNESLRKRKDLDQFFNAIRGQATSSPGQDIETPIDLEQGTGSLPTQGTKIVDVDFDRYQIKVELTIDDKFIRILEIQVKKDFRGLQEKAAIGDIEELKEFFIE